MIAPFLKSINRWEAPLRPLFLIGRHMLPVFSIEICLSAVLIGRTDSGMTVEPITSALVICQLVTAPLLGWFFEWRSVARLSSRSASQTPAAGTHLKVEPARNVRPHLSPAARSAWPGDSPGFPLTGST